MSKRRKKKKLKRIIIILITIILIGLVVYFFVFKKNNDIVDEINKYNYLISKNDTELMKTNFELLKEELKKDNIDYEKYAEYISKLFICDLYSIDVKENKYDIGGSEYVFPEKKENFNLKVQDTLYKYIENKNNRKQDLPVVSSIEMTNIEKDIFEYNNKEYDAYEVELAWEYKKELGYDNKATVILIKDNDFLYVASIESEAA